MDLRLILNGSDSLKPEPVKQTAALSPVSPGSSVGINKGKPENIAAPVQQHKDKYNSINEQKTTSSKYKSSEFEHIWYVNHNSNNGYYKPPMKTACLSGYNENNTIQFDNSNVVKSQPLLQYSNSQSGPQLPSLRSNILQPNARGSQDINLPPHSQFAIFTNTKLQQNGSQHQVLGPNVSASVNTLNPSSSFIPVGSQYITPSDTIGDYCNVGKYPSPPQVQPPLLYSVGYPGKNPVLVPLPPGCVAGSSSFLPMPLQLGQGEQFTAQQYPSQQFSYTAPRNAPVIPVKSGIPVVCPLAPASSTFVTKSPQLSYEMISPKSMPSSSPILSASTNPTSTNLPRPDIPIKGNTNPRENCRKKNKPSEKPKRSPFRHYKNKSSGDDILKSTKTENSSGSALSNSDGKDSRPIEAASSTNASTKLWRFVDESRFKNPRPIVSASSLKEYIVVIDEESGSMIDDSRSWSTKRLKYACKECGRSFFRKSDLVRHIQIHLGIKPNICHVCGKQFIQRSALTVHLRVHTGEKPFNCSKCGRAFSDSSSLARHRRIHQKNAHPVTERIKTKPQEPPIIKDTVH